MYTIKSVLHLARSQVGYHEGHSSKGWDNVQKFSEQLPGFGWSDGQPWCDVFVQWCLWQAAIDVPEGVRSASCGMSVSAYKRNGRFTEFPVTGGQIFYGPSGGTHCGLVTGWDGVHVYTIEGNTNADGGAEGNAVLEKIRTRRDEFVYGYGIPYYPHDRADTPSPLWAGKSLAR